MRIGIDARFYGEKSGLGRYVTMIVRYLIDHPDSNEYLVFVSHHAPEAPFSSRVRIVRTRIGWYGFREQLALPLLLYRHRLDLVHFPHWNVPLLYRRPYVVTIHDLILLRFPASHASTRHPLFFALKYLMYRIVLRNTLRTAKKIIAVSDFTKNDIETSFPFTRNTIAVVHEASALLGSHISEGGSRVGTLPENYLLYVGAAYPHKNLQFLIDQFARWRARNPDFYLVLVGQEDYFYRRLSEYARSASYAHVRFVGAVSDVDLATIYARARAYVFPSLHEGFGLPALEAMASGVPVLSSSASCLPEILGDAAMYFDPRDADGLIRGLDQVVHDERIRARLRASGLLQARRYSWDRMGAELVKLYQTAQN